jgi:methionyl-tRNA formyltransferase
MDKYKPQIGVCAAFKAGFILSNFLLNSKHDIEFVVTSDKDDSPYEKDIVKLCEEKNIKIYRHQNVNTPEFIEIIKSHNIDLMMLTWWPSIIKKESIHSAKLGWINMHPSLLPYNRGKHPYYWSIVDSTPFGATLHLINEGVDTGPILFQKEIPVDITDTGEKLYQKGMDELINLFEDNFDKMATLDFIPKEQLDKKATFHLAKDIIEHSKIDLEKEYKALDLINIIRGRSFVPSDQGSYFYHNGKKYIIKVSIKEAKEKT